MRLSNREISTGIIDGCRHGDRDAFRALYEIYSDKVYSIAVFFFHGDAATASDVTQQVFLKLMTDFAQFRGDSVFSTWLYRMVVNTCIDVARGRKHHVLPVTRAVVEAAAAPGSHEDDVAGREMAGSVRSAVSALPQRFRLAILLRYFEELSYEEMAKILNCSMGTVASRLSRGHRMLAEKLAPFRNRTGREK